MKNIIKIFFILSVIVGFTACETDKPILTYQGDDFIFFNEGSGSVQESNPSVNYILVKLASGEQSTDVTVDFTITSDAVEGADYDLLNASNTLTFKAGSYTDTIKISAIDNIIEDGSKLLSIELSNGGEFVLGYPGVAANNSVFEFSIIDDDCALVADYFVGSPSGVEYYPSNEYETVVGFKLVSEVGSIVTYEVSGIMTQVFGGWGEVVDTDLPSGGNNVFFIFDNTNPLAPVINITGVPSIVPGLGANMCTTDGGAWIYDITIDDTKASTFSTCEKTAEIYYNINVAEPGSDYGPRACYLKLDFK